MYLINVPSRLKLKCSYNGDRLLRFIDASELSVVNTPECCNGFYARILNNQRSAIDYILMSNELIHKVDQVFIDEESTYDLNSDHVIISINIIHSKGGNKNKTLKVNHKENYMKWAVQNNTKWEDFQKCLNEEFSRNKLLVNSNDINIMWETWKANINKAATNAIGMKKKVKN